MAIKSEATLNIPTYVSINPNVDEVILQEISYHVKARSLVHSCRTGTFHCTHALALNSFVLTKNNIEKHKNSKSGYKS